MNPPLFCGYCGHAIAPDQDAQWVDTGMVAHTDCAWAVDSEFWAEVDRDAP